MESREGRKGRVTLLLFTETGSLFQPGRFVQAWWDAAGLPALLQRLSHVQFKIVPTLFPRAMMFWTPLLS